MPSKHTQQASGGVARGAKLSPERRAEIARAAAAKRWAKPTLKPDGFHPITGEPIYRAGPKPRTPT